MPFSHPPTHPLTHPPTHPPTHPQVIGNKYEKYVEYLKSDFKEGYVPTYTQTDMHAWMSWSWWRSPLLSIDLCGCTPSNSSPPSPGKQHFSFPSPLSLHPPSPPTHPPSLPPQQRGFGQGGAQAVLLPADDAHPCRPHLQAPQLQHPRYVLPPTYPLFINIYPPFFS